MTNSIVMSVYNGEKYLEEQLASLTEQTLLPNEIIIIDDCSTDKTLDIIKKFVMKNSHLNIKLIENKTNKGWQRNFFDGMKLAKSDIIFPCDQDDIWHKDKIKNMVHILENNPQIMVLEGQPHKFFDESDKQNKQNIHTWIGNLLDKIVNKKEICNNTKNIFKKELSPLYMRRSPGCTLALKKIFFDKVKFEWFEGMPHDQLITNYAIVIDSYYVFDYEVIEWRRHVGSASNPKERNKERRMHEITLDKEMINALLNYAIRENVNKKYISIIQESKKWNETRERIVFNQDKLSMIKIFKYMKFYYLKRRVLTDLKYGFIK